MKKTNLLVSLEAIMMAVLALIIGLIPASISASYGISLGIIPILVFAYRRGVGPAVLAGLMYGALKLLVGDASILTPFQVIIEYFFAFAFIGLAGLGRQRVLKKAQAGQTGQLLAAVLLTSLLGVGLEYLVHFFAGVAFWGEFAPEGMNVWIFSLSANAISGGLTWLAAALVSFLLIKSSPNLIDPKR
ncbi:hypothetical protein AWM75_03000 [Aerococcus urinaehominis]|uniref:Uncharacterized protein n=1 Tax=Aerococcus urinaehominis TaxID=128944 RepID=A0A0X8FKJ5_9LACT|nr:energy-coupled thiamine transporter ThiT [Aerococcus urinaehominis]AMB99028.1 hypothetical protein AWM75_03000 [Aerococcus urinaehominis]SDM51213.1 thiamine transporter [Aerococcus urinaehominis]